MLPRGFWPTARFERYSLIYLCLVPRLHLLTVSSLALLWGRQKSCLVFHWWLCPLASYFALSLAGTGVSCDCGVSLAYYSAFDTPKCISLRNELWGRIRSSFRNWIYFLLPHSLEQILTFLSLGLLIWKMELPLIYQSCYKDQKQSVCVEYSLYPS